MRAFVFPGQGSQAVGMGVALSAASPSAREVFQEVDQALGQNLFRLMTEGPEDQLTLTENAQPAIMANAIATLRVIEREGGVRLSEKADFVAGHSLGEYTAICAAGAFDLATTARLLKLRGQAMQAATPVGTGAMAALLGADIEKAQNLADAAAEGDVCTVANDNDPSQVVISGDKAAIERAIALVKDFGIKRGVLLPVSAPFHCPLMQPAADAMADASAAAPRVRQCDCGTCGGCRNNKATARGTSHRPGALARICGGDVGCGRDGFCRNWRKGTRPHDQTHRARCQRDECDLDGRYRGAPEGAIRLAPKREEDCSRGDAETRRGLVVKDIDEISGDVVNLAIRLHRDLGPGLLESVYETVLARAVSSLGYYVERQKSVDIEFEGLKFEAAFRVDLMIDRRLVVEIKSVERLNLAHKKQLLTYLRLLKQPVGLLMNFGGATLKEGLHRVVNDHQPSASPRLRVNQN
jgi:[acyl-carrier-protein] S-malonyltransferase